MALTSSRWMRLAMEVRRFPPPEPKMPPIMPRGEDAQSSRNRVTPPSQAGCCATGFTAKKSNPGSLLASMVQGAPQLHRWSLRGIPQQSSNSSKPGFQILTLMLPLRRFMFLTN
ncbi:hypothetical protein CEXT_228711 [Caerostris extrusa]|uniref:Uncharacterized protein n=1 Tax=Caerostris extrusa TaxID=172846 RepID=A0AAV4P084_CAEEX|nr:hypothetical protein CEXT_228711 [Caerostris extrusa]